MNMYMYMYVLVYMYMYICIVSHTSIIMCYSSIPDKLVRDWKLLFIKGKPLYDEDLLLGSTSTQDSLTDLDGNDILDNADLKEYLVSSN